MLLLRSYDRLLGWIGITVGLVFGFIVVLITINVLARSVPLFLNWIGIGGGLRPASLPWALELTEYLIYACAFIGAPWALRLGAHVRVDVFVSGLTPRVQRILDRVTDLIGLGTSLLLLGYGAAAVAEAWNTSMYARKTWDFPEWLLLLAIPVSGLLLSIEFVLRLLRVGVSADHTSNPTSTGI
jgi:TRAP-type C4-dicarboxylate transport system permease small subunit